MRIMMLAQFYPPIVGGEERMVETLAVGLARRGHEISVATLAHADLPAFEERDGVRIHRLQSLAQRFERLFSESSRRHAVPAPDPVTLHGLRALLAREWPHVVHAHNWLVHSMVPLKRWSGAALLLSLHDMSLVCPTRRFVYEGAPCGGPGFRRCVANASRHYGAVKGVSVALSLRRMQPALLDAVDMFLPVSRAVADGCGLDARALPYEVMPNVLDDELYADPPEPDSSAGLPDDGFTLFVGDLVEDKGIDVLLDAYAGLSDAPPLVLIGRPYSSRLRSLPASVLMLGPRRHADVLAAWRRCALGVVPSTGPEAFGLAALEAQAAGKPVIATRVGGLPEVVLQGETGVLIPPGDVGALRTALRTLLSDPAARSRLGEAARGHAARFAASERLPRLEHIYERITDRRAAGASR